MILPSHLLAVLLMGASASLVRPWGPKAWALALGFGVAIDADHLLQFPAYLATHGGFSGLQASTMAAWGAEWQGFMHTPWGLAVVTVAGLLWRSWIPFAAWGLHMVQDFVVATRFVPFGSPLEFAVDGVLLALVAVAFLADHRLHGGGKSLGRHLAGRFGLVRAEVSPP